MKKMKVFVTGSGGLVGSRFVELLDEEFNLVCPEIDSLDITDKKSVNNFINDSNFDSVLNFAAYTNVTEAERQRGDVNGLCWKVNVEGTRNLVNSINPRKTHFIHISTDMVFTGSADDSGPYSENHKPEMDPDKLTWYGYTKSKAEEVVKNKLGKKSAIVRLIYPVRKNNEKKLDYLHKPIKLYEEGKLYPLFSDQQISITYIDEACEILRKIINEKHFGVFHASSRDITTPYQLISYALKKSGKLGKKKVRKTSLKKYIANGADPRRYPIFGGLSVVKTEEMLGVKLNKWRDIVEKVLT